MFPTRLCTSVALRRRASTLTCGEAGNSVRLPVGLQVPRALLVLLGALPTVLNTIQYSKQSTNIAKHLPGKQSNQQHCSPVVAVPPGVADLLTPAVGVPNVLPTLPPLPVPTDGIRFNEPVSGVLLIAPDGDRRTRSTRWPPMTDTLDAVLVLPTLSVGEPLRGCQLLRARCEALCALCTAECALLGAKLRLWCGAICVCCEVGLAVDVCCCGGGRGDTSPSTMQLNTSLSSTDF